MRNDPVNGGPPVRRNDFNQAGIRALLAAINAGQPRRKRTMTENPDIPAEATAKLNEICRHCDATFTPLAGSGGRAVEVLHEDGCPDKIT